MNEDTFHLGVKALIRNKEGKILLLKVNKAALKDYNGEPYWDIPGGRVQKGDSIEKTLVREVAEEIGVSEVTSIKPVAMVLSTIRIPLEKDVSVGLILSVYICEIAPNIEIVLSEEHTEYGWFSAQESARLLEVKYPIEFIDAVRKLELKSD